MPTFPKYDSYQPTNVGWLGDIPTHWGLKKNKFLLKEKKKTVGKKSDDFTLLSLTLSGLIARDMENPQGKFPAEFNNYKIVQPDDLVFCLFDVEETPRTVGYASLRGMITGAYDIFECGSEIHSKYLYYYYLWLDFDKRLQPLYSGLRKVIKLDAFLGAKSPVPPLEEQKRIVEFLDRITTEIDRAISQKQRLIELLQEQKAILINQAVTKGLNPNVPMRDSGIDWLDKIPEHWKVLRLKQVWKIIDCKHLTAPFVDEGYPLASIQEVQKKRINLEEANKTTDKFYQRLTEGNRKPIIGDIVYSRNASVGAASLVDLEEDFALGQDVCLFRSSQNDGSFFVHQLRADVILKQLNQLLIGSTFNRINISQIKELAVCVPPLDEQQEIDHHINELESQIDNAISIINKEIRALRELTSVFIAEAVTGKIKV